MSFQHFQVLMWKNFHLKLYHWKATLAELLIPIAAVGLLVFGYRQAPSLLGTRGNASAPAGPLYTAEAGHIHRNATILQLAYAPSKLVISGFMNTSKRRGEFKNVGIVPLDDETEVENHVFNQSAPHAVGVFFHNTESISSLPDKLSYLIRKASPMEPFAPIYDDYFIATQYLLNELFVDNVTSRNVSATLGKLQKLSFPEVVETYSGNPKLSILFYLYSGAIFIASLTLISDIVEEKNSGLKEMMRISGVKEWMIYLCWFIHAMSIFFVSITVCVILLKYLPIVNKETIIHFTPFFVLWSFLVLYCAANVSFCFMLSSILQNSSILSILLLLYNMIFGIAFVHFDQYVPYVGWIIPWGVYRLGFEEIWCYEGKELDMTLNSFRHTQNKQFRYVPYGLMLIFILLAINTLLYFILGWYIISIYPGKFGTRKSPFFMFQALFSLFSKKKSTSAPLASADYEINPKYFETPPSNLITSIVIKDLHKHFKGLHAVRGVNLTTYEGEITALLGHNGAGKTTTLSILTGLISHTSGAIYYKNSNIFENMDQFRLLVGLCPQENRLFTHLSVMNHLIFFGQLKGLSMPQAHREALEYLHITSLTPKMYSLVDELSGGMKRKLCLCIAMMGKAEVLILDEPSSGMDAESRRSLWNLLLKLRQGRTMILTTHYMEEADILGDRIAIMNHGIIVCYGTSLFLKKAYDTGYDLTITKSIDNSKAITQLIETTIPTASVVSDSAERVVYKLPLTETNKFSALFKALEASKTNLGIQEIGVNATTMEHVFLKAGGASAYDPKSPKTIASSSSVQHAMVTGVFLFIQQLWAVFKKKILFTTRDLTNIFFRVFLFLLILYLLLRKEKTLPGQVETLTYAAHHDGKVIYQEVDPGVSMEKQIEEYVTEYGGELVKGNGTDINQLLFSIAIENPVYYQTEYLCAISVVGENVIIMYSREKVYSLPVALDLYYNVLLRSLTGGKKYSVEATYREVLSASIDRNGNKKSSVAEQCAGESQFGAELVEQARWFLILAFFPCDVLSYFSPFVSIERMDGFYHIQMMSRLNPLVYWFGTLLFDLLLFFIFMIFIIGTFTIYNSADLLQFHEPFYILLLALVLFGSSYLLMIYVFSYLINTKNGSFKYFFPFSVTIAIVVWIYHFLHLLISNYDEEKVEELSAGFLITYYIMQLSIYIFPSGTYFYFFLNLMAMFNINSRCSKCGANYIAECESLLEKIKYWDSHIERKKHDAHNKHDEHVKQINPFAIKIQIITLGVQIIVFLLILLLLSTGIFGMLGNMIKVSLFGSLSTRLDRGDDDVVQENINVQRYKNDIQRKQRTSVSLLVDGLRKNFVVWCQNYTAVSNASFFVERGSCFGLLGVNGAGKTTTFKMLTAEIVPTAGDASIDGFKLSEDKDEYLSRAGYCPQTNCFIEQLTGYEMLNLIALMRGVRGVDLKTVINKWISIVGLEEYKNRKCGTYSGGNKRKLCSAMSLIGDPNVVFLDEPTSGVDPVSRRNLYDVMAQSKLLGQTVVLTSHSMEECEVLCDKLTIMVSGIMKCIGSVQHLKRRYAQGFSLSIKIIDSVEAANELPAFKEFLNSAFAPVRIILRDERAGVLSYQITDTTLLWSVLFERMEAIKLQYPTVVDDYVLADTSLEEVFISFAQTQARF